jgi:predicted NBD/HSP70 family sugar kinase
LQWRYGRTVASYLAIDVGTDRLAAGVVDTSGDVVVRDRVATPPRDWSAAV